MSTEVIPPIFSRHQDEKGSLEISKIQNRDIEDRTERALETLTVTLAILCFLNGCQAMAGETMGQNLGDGALATSVKTQLASDKLVTLTRLGVETDNGIVYLTGDVETAEQKSRVGSVASRVKGVKQVVNNLQVIKR